MRDNQCETLLREEMCAQLCPTLCDLVDCSLPGFSVHGISQARILEWDAISPSRGSSRPRDWTASPALAGGFFSSEPPWSGRSLYVLPKMVLGGVSDRSRKKRTVLLHAWVGITNNKCRHLVSRWLLGRHTNAASKAIKSFICFKLF